MSKAVIPITIKGVQFTATQADFDGLSFEETLIAGVTLCRAVNSSPWWIGAWVESIERRFLAEKTEGQEKPETKRYGLKYEAAAAATGLENGTLRTCLWVYKAVNLSRRRDKLSWSHHREVAHLDPKAQGEWLDRAIANEWSKSDLRQALRRANKEVHDEPDLDIGFVTNKWVNEFRRGIQSAEVRLGPVERWDDALRQAWKRDMKPVVEFYQKL
jgi:hypothetical protein